MDLAVVTAAAPAGFDVPFLGSFLVFMPAILLSGFMFPVSSMPRSLQWLTLANPVRHYIEIARDLLDDPPPYLR